MRLLYTSTARLTTTKAHGLQIVENCVAFAAAGAEVTLVLARRRRASGPADPDPRDRYGVPRTFSIRYLPCLDLQARFRALEPTAYRLMGATFGTELLANLRRLGKDAVVYGREPLPLGIASLGLPPARLVYEAHQLPSGGPGRHLHAFCVRRAGLVVTVTDRLSVAVRASGARSTLVARDGFRADRFAELPERDAARRALGLPLETFIVGYVGQLRTMEMSKGVDALVDAAARLQDFSLALAVVGGPADQVDALRRRWLAHGLSPERFVAPGQVPPESVPVWLAALDVGTIPFPAMPHFSECASPLKMFEYLAAGLPIVASDLPSIAEVLEDGQTALLTPPGDVSALAAALQHLREDVTLRRSLGARARRAAAAYTWNARARRILDAIRALES